MLGVLDARDYTENDENKCNGIFKVGTIIDGRRILVDKEEGDKRHSQRSYEEM